MWNRELKEKGLRKENGNAKTQFFERFSISPGDPDREMLRVIVSDFTRLPYENLTKIISKFSIDDPSRRMRSPEQVIDGFIENSTGGTCFSLTWCLGSILDDSGFRCYPVMADMKRANVHCALIVHIDEQRFIADPGYLLGEPLELTGSPLLIDTSFGKVELRPGGSASCDLYTVTGSERKWRYRVRTSPVSIQLFLKYWQESFSLSMMNSLQLTKLTDKGHLYVKDHHLRYRQGDRKISENIGQELYSRIEREFGIPPEITTRAHEYIDRHRV
ncbi:MAG: arylamine N-acetyltransferase [Bacteroidales bacterium]|nr:arylamine N-acetyltransferase [Candidatus Latescibacterota bacterium]